MHSLKVNLLHSNLTEEEDNLKVLVDDIWNCYDFDDSGELDINELRDFVKEFMPLFIENFEFSEQNFQETFKEIDLDDSGTINK